MKEHTEDLFKIGTAVINISNSLGDPVSQVKPNAAVFLALSSCYYSLLRNCDALTRLIHQEHVLGSTKNAESQIHIPSITVGSVQVDMPAAAVAEIILYLINKMARNLQVSLKCCALRTEHKSTPSNLDDPGFAATTTADLLWQALGDLDKTEDQFLGKLAATSRFPQ